MESEKSLSKTGKQISQKRFVTGLILALALVLVISGAIVTLVRPGSSAKADPSYLMSWVGTSSSMTGANEQWVQDFINAAVVQPDGTIWTASGWDEAHHEYGDYKDGQVVGSNLWENRHGLTSNSSRTVVDRDGRTWNIENASYTGGDRVCRDGGICIGPEGNFHPNALAIANDGSLMVADNGPDQQIKFYNIGGDATELVNTFGEQGGAWAGPEPGRTGPMRFHGLWGTGQDEAGNIYVIGNFPGGGSWMRSLQADGTMNWQLYGKIWVSNAVPDTSTDGTVVYDHNVAYQVDYGQTAPGHLAVGDFPYAVTVDPWNHPDDPRLSLTGNGGIDEHYTFTHFVPKWIRDCHGKKYMFTIGMFGGGIGAWVQEGPYWVQKSYVNGPTDWPWASFIDTNCDIWLSSGDGYVSQYATNGADDAGNLTYDGATTYDQITGFNEITRISYDRENDIVSVSGYTPEHPNAAGWGEAGPVFKRFTNWKSGRQEGLTIDLPYNKVFDSNGNEDAENSTYPQEWEVMGDYLFVVFGTRGEEHHEHGTANVYSLSDGSRTSILRTTDPILPNDVGWIDVKGLTTIKRSNGEYVLFIEEDWKNKSLVYRWCPSGNC